MKKIGEITVYKDEREFESSLVVDIIFTGKPEPRRWEWADAKELKV